MQDNTDTVTQSSDLFGYLPSTDCFSPAGRGRDRLARTYPHGNPTSFLKDRCDGTLLCFKRLRVDVGV